MVPRPVDCYIGVAHRLLSHCVIAPETILKDLQGNGVHVRDVLGHQALEVVEVSLAPARGGEVERGVAVDELLERLGAEMLLVAPES